LTFKDLKKRVSLEAATIQINWKTAK